MKSPTESELRRYYEAHRADFASARESSLSANPSFDVRERVLAAYRGEQTALAFRAQLTRITSQYAVHVAERP